MAALDPDPSSKTPASPPQPLAQQSTYLLPKLHALYTGSLSKTLSKCSYPSFAACFPTPATKKPEVLATVHRQIIDKIEAKALAEFRAICQERDLDARFGELEEVIKDARIRSEASDAGGGSGGGAGQKGLHLLKPEELFLATLAPKLGDVKVKLQNQIQEQEIRNEEMVKELLEKRAEVMRILGGLEDVVRDMEDANQVLYAAAKEMDDVPMY